MALWAAVSVNQWEPRSQSTGFIETNNKLQFSYTPEQQSEFHFSVKWFSGLVSEFLQWLTSAEPNIQMLHK